MRQIRKSAEPTSLTAHRLQAHATYDNYPDKDGLRNSLAREQYSLCCYCAGRIFAEPNKMKIEHFSCQPAHPNLQLAYANLLGACLGGQGRAEDEQHCDTRKGSKTLSRSPASPTNIEDFLAYSGDGTIYSDDESFSKELDEVLNLNTPILKQNRKSTLSAILEGVGKANRGTLTREQWSSYRHTPRWSPITSGKSLKPELPGAQISIPLRRPRPRQEAFPSPENCPR